MVCVKICGITNWADAKLAVDRGADFLGFNFYARSPRYITPDEARRIVRKLPKRIIPVGVFVNHPEEQLIDAAREVGLRWVQLHGEESPQVVFRVNRHFAVIKAFRVRPNFRPGSLARYTIAAARMLDGFEPHLRGGTGKIFDWKFAVRAKRYGPLFLAGGIKPENVREAIRTIEPFAIDVCSGVEARPGKKDAKRLKALMAEVEQARHEMRNK